MPRATKLTKGIYRPEVKMLKKLTLFCPGIILALVIAFPARSQESLGDPPSLAIIPIRESTMAPAISYPQSQPVRPEDPAVVQTVRRACCDRIGDLQIQTTNGILRRGKVHGSADQESFIFRPSNSKSVETVHYCDVISATPLPPTFGEATLAGIEMAGLVALA